MLDFLLSFLDQGLDQLGAYKNVQLGHTVPTVHGVRIPLHINP